MEEEQLIFKTQQLVYDHPLTVFIRQLQVHDRLALDSCQNAFISYVRAYKEYELKILLNLNNVKLGPLAMSMGMLVLPKVAELRQFFLNFKKWDGDLEQVKYQDKNREKQRQQRIQAEKQRQSEPTQ